MEEAQTLVLNKGAERLLQDLISISIIQFNREKGHLKLLLLQIMMFYLPRKTASFGEWRDFSWNI